MENEIIKISSKENNSSYSESIAQISESVRIIGQTLSKMFGYDNTVSDLKKLGETLAKLASTAYMSSVKEAINSIVASAYEAEKNPNSYFNYVKYRKLLREFHWAWLFNITPEELKLLLEKANNEEEFDELAASFFDDGKIQSMFSFITEMLPRRHRVMFKQVKFAFNNKCYALVNSSVMSIIDNLLSVVIKNKGRSTRKEILNPIIKFYFDNYRLGDIGFAIEISILSNNIDLLFDDYSFGGRINVGTHKKVRRHLSLHGVKYSNQRIDSIMVLNTLATLMKNMKYLKPFENSLIYKGKKFLINLNEKAIYKRINKQLKLNQSV